MPTKDKRFGNSSRNRADIPIEAEEEEVAERFRSEGQGEAARIQGERERELQRIQSEGFKTAEELRGEADAEATDIYAAAYGRVSALR